MSRRRSFLTASLVVSVAVTGAVPGGTAHHRSQQQRSPYVLRAVPGVVSTSILTVGDWVGEYRLEGIPDGLGAFDNGDGPSRCW